MIGMKTLTKAEEQIMQILWDLKEGVVKDVVEQFEEPRPAYTTVATVLKSTWKTKDLSIAAKLATPTFFS
jgi:BlaI family transcriptional regulator, penicillinase repressor